MKTFVNYLYRVLYDLEMTHARFAKRIRVSRPYLTKIADSRVLPSPKLMRKICRALKKNEDEVFPHYGKHRKLKFKAHEQLNNKRAINN
jgi:transcriptional regulator with XRE-family HTH domain